MKKYTAARNLAVQARALQGPQGTVAAQRTSQQERKPKYSRGPRQATGSEDVTYVPMALPELQFSSRKRSAAVLGGPAVRPPVELPLSLLRGKQREMPRASRPRSPSKKLLPVPGESSRGGVAPRGNRKTRPPSLPPANPGESALQQALEPSSASFSSASRYKRGAGEPWSSRPASAGRKVEIRFEMPQAAALGEQPEPSKGHSQRMNPVSSRLTESLGRRVRVYGGPDRAQERATGNAARVGGLGRSRVGASFSQDYLGPNQDANVPTSARLAIGDRPRGRIAGGGFVGAVPAQGLARAAIEAKELGRAAAAAERSDGDGDGRDRTQGKENNSSSHVSLPAACGGRGAKTESKSTESIKSNGSNHLGTRRRPQSAGHSSRNLLSQRPPSAGFTAAEQAGRHGSSQGSFGKAPRFDHHRRARHRQRPASARLRPARGGLDTADGSHVGRSAASLSSTGASDLALQATTEPHASPTRGRPRSAVPRKSSPILGLTPRSAHFHEHPARQASSAASEASNRGGFPARAQRPVSARPRATSSRSRQSEQQPMALVPTVDSSTLDRALQGDAVVPLDPEHPIPEGEGSLAAHARQATKGADERHGSRRPQSAIARLRREPLAGLASRGSDENGSNEAGAAHASAQWVHGSRLSSANPSVTDSQAGPAADTFRVQDSVSMVHGSVSAPTSPNEPASAKANRSVQRAAAEHIRYGDASPSAVYPPRHNSPVPSPKIQSPTRAGMEIYRLTYPESGNQHAASPGVSMSGARAQPDPHDEAVAPLPSPQGSPLSRQDAGSPSRTGASYVIPAPELYTPIEEHKIMAFRQQHKHRVSSAELVARRGAASSLDHKLNRLFLDPDALPHQAPTRAQPHERGTARSAAQTQVPVQSDAGWRTVPVLDSPVVHRGFKGSGLPLAGSDSNRARPVYIKRPSRPASAPSVRRQQLDGFQQHVDEPSGAHASTDEHYHPVSGARDAAPDRAGNDDQVGGPAHEPSALVTTASLLDGSGKTAIAGGDVQPNPAGDRTRDAAQDIAGEEIDPAIATLLHQQARVSTGIENPSDAADPSPGRPTGTNRRQARMSQRNRSHSHNVFAGVPAGHPQLQSQSQPGGMRPVRARVGSEALAGLQLSANTHSRGQAGSVSRQRPQSAAIRRPKPARHSARVPPTVIGRDTVSHGAPRRSRPQSARFGSASGKLVHGEISALYAHATQRVELPPSLRPERPASSVLASGDSGGLLVASTGLRGLIGHAGRKNYPKTPTRLVPRPTSASAVGARVSAVGRSSSGVAVRAPTRAVPQSEAEKDADALPISDSDRAAVSIPPSLAPSAVQSPAGTPSGARREGMLRSPSAWAASSPGVVSPHRYHGGYLGTPTTGQRDPRRRPVSAQRTRERRVAREMVRQEALALPSAGSPAGRLSQRLGSSTRSNDQPNLLHSRAAGSLEEDSAGIRLEMNGEKPSQTTSNHTSALQYRVGLASSGPSSPSPSPMPWNASTGMSSKKSPSRKGAPMSGVGFLVKGRRETVGQQSVSVLESRSRARNTVRSPAYLARGIRQVGARHTDFAFYNEGQTEVDKAHEMLGVLPDWAQPPSPRSKRKMGAGKRGKIGNSRGKKAIKPAENSETEADSVGGAGTLPASAGELPGPQIDLGTAEAVDPKEPAKRDIVPTEIDVSMEVDLEACYHVAKGSDGGSLVAVQAQDAPSDGHREQDVKPAHRPAAPPAPRRPVAPPSDRSSLGEVSRPAVIEDHVHSDVGPQESLVNRSRNVSASGSEQGS